MTIKVVTQGQNVVRAPTQLRQFFLCYNAAYLLYNNPPPDLFPPIIDELNKVLNNPIFIAVAAPQLLQSRRSQTTAVLRALLTDATQAPSTLDPLFEQAFVTAPNLSLRPIRWKKRLLCWMPPLSVARLTMPP